MSNAFTIANGCNVPLNTLAGTTPDVSGALMDWFQPMQFSQLVKTVVNFQNFEVPTVTNTRGVMWPAKQNLIMDAAGQRSWIDKELFCLPDVVLNVDDIIVYLDVQYRVLSKVDYTLNGYVFYRLTQDYTP